MTPENWTDLFGTIRAIFTQLPQIIAAVAAIFAGYWAFKSRTLGLETRDLGIKNSDHLAAQDKSIRSIDNKVLTIASRAAEPIDDINIRLHSLADDIKKIREAPGPGE